MSAEDHLRIVRRFIDIFNTQHWAQLAEVLAEDTSYHSPVFPAPLTGITAIHHYFEEVFVAIPDCQVETHRLFGQDPYVCWEYMFTGTHRGPLRGLPPTYKSLRVPLCWILTLEDGKITRIDSYLDHLGYRAQLGIE